MKRGANSPTVHHFRGAWRLRHKDARHTNGSMSSIDELLTSISYGLCRIFKLRDSRLKRLCAASAFHPAFRNTTQALIHMQRSVELIEMAADDSHVRQAAQQEREPRGDPHLDDGSALQNYHEVNDPEWV